MSEQTDTVLNLDALARQAQYPALGFEIQAHYANVVISFGPGTFLVQSVTAEQMNDICQQWLSRHSKQPEAH